MESILQRNISIWKFTDQNQSSREIFPSESSLILNFVPEPILQRNIFIWKLTDYKCHTSANPQKKYLYLKAHWF